MRVCIMRRISNVGTRNVKYTYNANILKRIFGICSAQFWLVVCSHDGRDLAMAHSLPGDQYFYCCRACLSCVLNFARVLMGCFPHATRLSFLYTRLSCCHNGSLETSVMVVKDMGSCHSSLCTSLILAKCSGCCWDCMIGRSLLCILML